METGSGRANLRSVWQNGERHYPAAAAHMHEKEEKVNNPFSYHVAPLTWSYTFHSQGNFHMLKNLEKLDDKQLDEAVKTYLSYVKTNGLSFIEFLHTLISEPFKAQFNEVKKHFDRLFKTNITLSLDPLSNQIDINSGFLDRGLKMFLVFVFNTLYLTFGLTDKTYDAP